MKNIINILIIFYYKKFYKNFYTMDELNIQKYSIKNFNEINNNEKYIFYLIKTSNIRLLDYYLSTRPKSIFEIDEDGNTPLFYAIYKNDYKLVKLCIQYKSDVNSLNNQVII